MKKVFAAVFFFSLVMFANGCSQAPSQSSDEYLGGWKITDMNGRVSQLTINENGTIQSDQKSLTGGTWTMDGARVHIVWSNGRNDFLYHSGNKFKVITYLPGVSVDATVGVNADAERVSDLAGK